MAVRGPWMVLVRVEKVGAQLVDTFDQECVWWVVHETAGDDRVHRAVVQTMRIRGLAGGGLASGCVGVARAAAMVTWNLASRTWNPEKGVLSGCPTGHAQAVAVTWKHWTESGCAVTPIWI